MRNKNRKISKYVEMKEATLKSEDCTPDLSKDTVEKINEVVKEVGVISNLDSELGFTIEMCHQMLRHSDFDGINVSGTDNRSIAYSRIQGAVTRLKIARDKLK